MKRAMLAISILLCLLMVASATRAQALEICSRSSGTPSFGEAWGSVPYLFGKVILNGFDPDSKLPKVTVAMTERGRPEIRVLIDKTGNYCFRRTNAETAAVLVVYLETTEVARRVVSDLGPGQQREDFELNADPLKRPTPPGTISAKYNYPPNDRTTELYKKALEAERAKDQSQLLDYVKQIVGADPADFIAWAKLGSLYFERKSFADAEDAFKHSLALKVDYVPGMISLSRVYLAQVKSDQAIALAQKAVAGDPKSARAYQVLGNAYLQAKKGSLGVEALNNALELDPVGMADSHLLLAVLYDRAGAKDLASREYRLFLAKVSDHPDKKKFEKYVKDNPE
jgi:tetratricopeptide (TPR) repeat protein